MTNRLLAALLLTATAQADEIRVISWNVESGGADPGVIARQLGELPTASIYALQEVSGQDIGRYGDAIRTSHGESYRYLASWTGRSDRMMVAFDEDRLTLVERRELFVYGGHTLNDWRHRSPLVCLFVDKASGAQFYFVTVHLARGSARLRESQARGLSAWAGDLKAPAIAAGDFNFDYDFKRQRGNAGFAACKKAGVWRWARPAKLIDTNRSDRDGDGVDNYPDSCLDFVYYAGLPDGWSVVSEVLVRDGDFPDDELTSDHRPVMAVVGR